MYIHFDLALGTVQTGDYIYTKCMYTFIKHKFYL